MSGIVYSLMMPRRRHHHHRRKRAGRTWRAAGLNHRATTGLSLIEGAVQRIILFNHGSTDYGATDQAQDRPDWPNSDRALSIEGLTTSCQREPGAGERDNINAAQDLSASDRALTGPQIHYLRCGIQQAFARIIQPIQTPTVEGVIMASGAAARPDPVQWGSADGVSPPLRYRLQQRCPVAALMVTSRSRYFRQCSSPNHRVNRGRAPRLYQRRGRLPLGSGRSVTDRWRPPVCFDTSTAPCFLRAR